MPNKIIVYEPNMDGPAHSEINAGLLRIISDIHPEQTGVFISAKKHYDALSLKINTAKWQHQAVNVKPYSPKNFLINELILIGRLIKLLRDKNAARIYLLGILPLSHILLSVLNRFYKKDVVMALHGQMEAYLPNTKIGFTKYYYLMAKRVFAKRNNHIRYLIFGESIKRNINFLFKGNQNTMVIDQPYVFDDTTFWGKSQMTSPIVLGVIGRADKGKNIHLLFDLINILKPQLDAGLIKIKMVGKLSIAVPQDYQKYLQTHPDIAKHEVFDAEIKSLDFALSFTDKLFYRATPSGVVFDCIKHNIPVLGLKNDFLSYYFDKFGPFGQLFGELSSLADEIINIAENPTAYHQQKSEINKVFERLKDELSLQVLTQKLAKAL